MNTNTVIAPRPDRAPGWLRPGYAWTAALLLLLLFAGYTAWTLLLREQSVRYASDEEHFKYGSTGTELDNGIPYWIWLVLPRVFPEKLPASGGYASLGMVWEPGHEVPVGISKRVVGFPRVNVNCAACHTSLYRTSADAVAPTVVAGGTAQTFDVQGYLRFLFACASDARFTPDLLLPEIERVYPLSALESALYRYVLIPKTRSALLQQKKRYAWMDTRPAWGRGRIDPFNPARFTYLQQPEDGSIGNSDMMSLWEMKDRPRGGYHWDGLNPVPREVVISSAIGDGSSPKIINRPDIQESLRRIEAFITDLPAPKYPFRIDTNLAKTGRELYVQGCASCHGGEGQQAGQLVPIAEIGTDAHRVEMWTESSARAYNQYTPGYDWELKAFRKQPGYVSLPLHGIWLRAPYLHNGSVPSLKELLEPATRRSTAFYRGNDVYDPDTVGFVSTQAQVKRGGIVSPLFLYDTTLPGNGNQGHTYGTELAPEAKRALLEFLKTL